MENGVASKQEKTFEERLAKRPSNSERRLKICHLARLVNFSCGGLGRRRQDLT